MPNTQTSVPLYAQGEVLTAANLNLTNSGIPVFATTVTRDAAFGGANEKVLAEGQFAYIEASNKLQYYDGSSWANLGSMTNVTVFTTSGTFTPPAGVTYAIAHIRSGGGGVGLASSGAGGTSSVAFAAGTISATGGNGMNMSESAPTSSVAGQANSGNGARATYFSNGGNDSEFILAVDGTEIVAGGTVTPAVGITVTVGAGGAAGTSGGAAGGSGYVWIEYQV